MPIDTGDAMLELSKSDDPRHVPVNKFGRNTNVDSTPTDIWDLTTQPIWLAPTAARIHTIASDNAADTTAGTGVDTVIVTYLPDWDTMELTETVSGNLNAGLPMVNAAVMIHRMETVPQATTLATVNLGTITATAAVDGTITAQINPGNGQTEMAIYGVPSTHTAYMPIMSAGLLKANLTSTEIFANIDLLYNPNPDVQTLAFLSKHPTMTASKAQNPFVHEFKPYKKFVGPGIIKMQANGSTINLDVSGGFDMFVHLKRS